ncbi:MAG: hypothetical protein ACHQVS_05085 [Candidatus Babeliales bacterium]
MMNIRSTLLASLMLAFTASTHAAQTATPEPLTTEQKDIVTTRVNNHMAAVGGTSVAALIAGLALKNDVLRGIGIGGSLGTACYALQNNKNWLFVWLASYLAHLGLTNKLQVTKPESIVLTANDIKSAEWTADKLIQWNKFCIPVLKDPEYIKKYPTSALLIDKDHYVREMKESYRNAKAYRAIGNSSVIAGLGAYLWLRYIARQAEQQVRAGA